MITITTDVYTSFKDSKWDTIPAHIPRVDRSKNAVPIFLVSLKYKAISVIDNMKIKSYDKEIFTGVHEFSKNKHDKSIVRSPI